ncbi:hypothetical protein TVAG_118010 [Trichomonas vaginalis G3]|uniref:Uncharacterized protein n=1 Tax=Trichomonas vaginalis (strain ATCC PRA-98 / G3) TaxID=412133 RepID=A2EHY8_TRIV3|nr:hypothetical protein TVAGG3_0230110 [Trichomonas vaginalis G3]EAY07720.1 hypothetical protein TVAG_118010 [Trichomonas vaginalis G3]KAI5552564.1 hypothetical protein TVAGG3_0230110 [Trichomonas vaginalis G3]|eukprot:XP_001319943.1 hypothetical protein [Trichomonas vaginalis G3]
MNHEKLSSPTERKLIFDDDAEDNDQVKQFKEEYQKLEASIKEKSRKKSRLNAAVRDLNSKLESMKKANKIQKIQQNEIEKSLRIRRKKFEENNSSYEKAKDQYIASSKKAERVKTIIEKIKTELQKAKILIESEESKLREIRPCVVDYGLLQTNIQLMKQRIDNKREILKQRNIDFSEAQQKMQQLVSDEQKYINSKNTLEENLDDLDARRHQTQQILTDPIDNLDYEESIVADAERDANETEQRHNQIQSDDGQQIIDKILEEIVALEKDNSVRREGLESKQKQLDAFKESYAKNPIVSPMPSKSPEIKYKSQPLSIAEAQEQVEKLSAQLEAKLQSVEDEERAIDDLVKNNILKRKEIDEKYKAKLEKLNQLQTLKNTTEALIFSVSELMAKNDHLVEISDRNQKSIDEINHRNANAERDRNTNNKFSLELQKLRQGLKDKEEERRAMDEMLAELKKQIEQSEKDYTQLEASLKMKEEEAAKIEENMKEITSKLENANQRAAEQKKLLDEFIEAHPYINRDPNDMIGQLAQLVSAA